MSWFQVAASVAGAALSFKGGLDAQDAAEEAGEAQAESILETAAENKRRRERDLKVLMGETEARVAASNLLMTGSVKRYRDDIHAEYRRQINWEQMKARMDAQAALKGAQVAGQAALYQGIGGAIGFASQAASAWPTSSGGGV